MFVFLSVATTSLSPFSFALAKRYFKLSFFNPNLAKKSFNSSLVIPLSIALSKKCPFDLGSRLTSIGFKASSAY